MYGFLLANSFDRGITFKCPRTQRIPHQSGNYFKQIEMNTFSFI